MGVKRSKIDHPLNKREWEIWADTNFEIYKFELTTFALTKLSECECSEFEFINFKIGDRPYFVVDVNTVINKQYGHTHGTILDVYGFGRSLVLWRFREECVFLGDQVCIISLSTDTLLLISY